MSENVLQLLTDDQISKGAKKLDELIDFTKLIKNKMIGAGAELLDGKAFKIALSGINSYVSKYVPDEFKDEFQLAVDDVLDGDKDFTVAAEQFFSVSTQLIEKLSEKNVKSFIIAGVSAVIDMIGIFVNSMLENFAKE
jgi:hypothetical protein